jgi:hypothetical protein
MSGQSFVSGVIKVFKVLFYGGEVGFSCCGGDGRGLISVQEFEGGILAVGVISRVMCKFDEGERVGPGFGVNGAKDGEVGFDFLVYPFGRSIRLGMECGGGRGLDPHQVQACLKALSHESGVSVGDDLVRATKPGEELLKDKVSRLFGRDGLLARRENDSFGEAMVHDNQNGVVALRRGEIGDKVHGALGKGAGFSACFDREQSWVGWSAVDLVLLTLRAALDVPIYEVGQAGPMVILLDRYSGGLLAGVSGGRNIVISSEDFSSELQIVWNVNSSKVKEKKTFVNRSEGPAFGGGRERGWSKGDKGLLGKFVDRVSRNDLSSEIGVVDPVDFAQL